jgi:hypothetical protein
MTSERWGLRKHDDVARLTVTTPPAESASSNLVVRSNDAIIKSALVVFVEQGTQGSLDDIATRADVANATH